MSQNSKGTNSAPKKPPTRWGTSTASFYADYEGETITVHLVMGDELRGVLVGVDTYDIFVERAEKSRLFSSSKTPYTMCIVG